MSLASRESIEAQLLPEVRQPAQYLGGELGAVIKDRAKLRGTFCLAFPDLYTIGMSHYGLQLLYSLMNRREGWSCERVFAPALDMEAMLRRTQLPLYSLETFTPLADFDVLGFTLQYELAATGILTILDLGKIPLRSADRDLTMPLVIAGGPVAATPEPFAPFIDAFIIGDGEESLPQVCDAWIELRGERHVRNHPNDCTGFRFGITDGSSGRISGAIGYAEPKLPTRHELLLALAKRFSFLYVPSLYEVAIQKSGRAGAPKPKFPGVPSLIHPARVENLAPFLPPPLRIVPNVEVVQDRIALEIMRGCPGRCRFCQSSAMKRPLRMLAPEVIVDSLIAACDATGIDEVSLLSLSTSDYPQFDELLELLRVPCAERKISISVPSLRVNQLLKTVMTKLTTERSSAFTLAPEAARMEMRERIGKPITDENLFAGCRSAFENGFNRVKMYFMVGLPEETAEDISRIIDLAAEIAYLGKEIRGRFPALTVNVSNFVPKPHTAFERLGMTAREELSVAHRQLKKTNALRTVSVKYHDRETSWLEALIARGDRRVAEVIEKAWQLGARLDAWSDHFRLDLWQAAIVATEIPTEAIIHETIPNDEELAWEQVRF